MLGNALDFSKCTRPLALQWVDEKLYGFSILRKEKHVVFLKAERKKKFLLKIRKSVRKISHTYNGNFTSGLLEIFTGRTSEDIAIKIACSSLIKIARKRNS